MSVADHNLPAVPGGLVGRERDVAEVADLVAGVRLVSVVGPGGVGKTRVAEAVATQAVDQFPDGVWLVELAAGRVAALGTPSSPGDWTTDSNC